MTESIIWEEKRASKGLEEERALAGLFLLYLGPGRCERVAGVCKSNLM